MYLVYITIGVALSAFLGSFFGLDAGWILSIVLTLFAGVASFIIGARRVNRHVAPAMAAVQRQMEAGHVEIALQTLEGMLPQAKWMPLLEGQIYAQMGLLAWHGQRRDRALDYLERSTPRSAEARMQLAAIRYQNGDSASALQALLQAGRFNGKNAFLFNFHAWLLAKEQRVGEAIQLLSKFVERNPTDASKDNLLRLQNGQKMNMRSFDMPWYALGFEKPPASQGVLQTGRKGFRQPPTNKGKAQKAKSKSRKR